MALCIICRPACAYSRSTPLVCYFFDPQTASTRRLTRSTNFDPSFLVEFMEFLHTDSPFIPRYLTAYECFTSIPSLARISLSPQMELIVQEGADLRRENLPVVDDVAALIPDEYAESDFWDVP